MMFKKITQKVTQEAKEVVSNEVQSNVDKLIPITVVAAMDKEQLELVLRCAWQGYLITSLPLCRYFEDIEEVNLAFAKLLRKIWNDYFPSQE